MNETNLRNLQGNLNEIYAAITAEKNNKQELHLCSTSSSKVYYQKSLMGKTIIFANKVYCYFRPYEIPSWRDTLQSILTRDFNNAVHHAYETRLNRILKNIQALDQIWTQTQNLELQRDRYAKFLSRELNNSIESNNSRFLIDCHVRKRLLTHDEEKTARQAIVNFHQATYEFWSLFFTNEQSNNREYDSLSAYITNQSNLRDKPLYKALIKEGRWTQIEGALLQSIPVTIFSKLHDPKSLTVDETRQLKFWVQSLNNFKDNISLKLLSTVLEEVINIIYIQGSSPVTLQDVLYCLEQHQCSLLLQDDDSHLDKRDRLMPGDKIDCNGKELILGQQLSPDKDIDTYKIFALENFPDYVVKIANNRFRLLIEEKKRVIEEEHCGVRLVENIGNIENDPQKAKVEGLDKQGRCVILEKLTPAFENTVWTSQSFKLSKKDKKLALVFANHLFCMNQWKSSAQNLKLSYLMWNKDGILKSTHLLKKGPPNYDELESYCALASKGNEFVLNYLMNVSKLNKHPIAIHYRQVIEHVLNTGEIELIGRALPVDHRQDEYTLHLNRLTEKAKELRNSCVKQIAAILRKKKQYTHHHQEQLKRSVISRLLEFYQALPTPGSFPNDFQENVIKSFSEPSFKKIVLTNTSELQEYYHHQYEKMMLYNRSTIR